MKSWYPYFISLGIRLSISVLWYPKEINMLEYINHLDQLLILRVDELHNSYLDMIMIFFTHLGDFAVLWISLTILCIWIKQTRSIGYTLLSWFGICLILGEGILKHSFNRLRPFQSLPEIHLQILAPITSSFPSGHSSAAFCFATIFTYFFYRKFPIYTILGWIVAIGIAVSRFYLQVHYISDIFVGIFIGIMSALLAIFISSRSFRPIISR